MANRWSDPETARTILSGYKTFAVVGCSPDSARDSHRVASFLQGVGYRVVPVNPGPTEILGEPCYPDLTAAAEHEHIEVVDIFRRSEEAGPHVDEAIAIGAKAVWMQLDVIDAAAAQRAHDAGLLVVMDRCPRIDHPRFFGATRA